MTGTFDDRVQLVGNLDNLEGSNWAAIGVRLEVPSDEDAGKKQTQIHLVAVQATADEGVG